MATAYHGTVQRPREWRRRVSIRARIRAGEDWGDCQVLNISTRGMLLQYSRPLNVGGKIEIRQQGQVVPATVVWCEGMRAGLSSERPIALADWLAAASDQAASLGCAGSVPAASRRREHRRDDDWQQLARKLQHVAVSAFAAALAMGAAAMAALALLEPLAAAAKALS